MRNVCLQTYRNSRVHQKVAYFFSKIHTSTILEFLGLRMRNLQGIISIWAWTYRESLCYFKIFSKIWCSAFFNLAVLYLRQKSIVTGLWDDLFLLKTQTYNAILRKYLFLKDIFQGICFCDFDRYSPIFPKQKRSELD